MANEKVDSIIELAGKLAGRADEIDQVLVIYRSKADDSQGSMDTGLTLAESLWLVDGFRFWLQAGAMGILKERDGGG